MAKTRKYLVIYVDGSYIEVAVPWEYQNDPDWLTTIECTCD